MDYSGVEKFVSAVLCEKIPATYRFHNLAHTQEVVRNVAIIAAQEYVAGDSLILLQTAALFHDAGYMVCYGGNEQHGADFAARELPRFDYSPEQIALVQELIMSTVFPQRPQSHLQKIICDADLFYLTSDTAIEKTILYRQELASCGRIFTDEEWYHFEMGFLNVQHFFTPYCDAIYRQCLPILQQQMKTLLMFGN